MSKLLKSLASELIPSWMKKKDALRKDAVRDSRTPAKSAAPPAFGRKAPPGPVDKS